MSKNVVRLFFSILLTTAVLFCIRSARSQSDEPRRLEITCVNNLKMINLSLRAWADDHGDRFPWNVTTNEGGAKELVVVDKNGFVANSWRLFQVISNELNSPVVLVCPGDSKKPAADFDHLTASNVTYRLHIVPDITPITASSSKVPLVVCPVDGSTAYYNGDVEVKKPQK
jgi:hypothetical protein